MRPILAVVFLTMAAALAGCETVEGAGRDLQAAGQVVSSGARQVQSSL